MHEVRTTERAILVSLQSRDEEADRHSIEELRELTSTAGAEIVGEFAQSRARPDHASYLGKGKAEELFVEVTEADADLVIVNGDL
ncbi:MAG: GTPase HflX, partial [Armatimonadetes bacterium]|nr:GTPase HflX [Armatimonadota bacterium]